jgi:hypothetical protein
MAQIVPSGTSSFGICLYESATGKFLVAGFLNNPGSSVWMAWYSALNAGSQTGYVGYTGYSLSPVPLNTTVYADLYFEVTIAAGQITLGVSTSGLDGTFAAVGGAGVAVTTAFTTAPDYVGLVGTNQTGTTAFTALVDWFRRMA